MPLASHIDRLLIPPHLSDSGKTSAADAVQISEFDWDFWITAEDFSNHKKLPGTFWETSGHTAKLKVTTLEQLLFDRRDKIFQDWQAERF